MDVRLHLAAIAANAVAGCGEWSRGSHNYDGDGDAAVVAASLARSRARDGLVAVGAGSFVALYDPEVCASVCVCVRLCVRLFVRVAVPRRWSPRRGGGDASRVPRDTVSCGVERAPHRAVKTDCASALRCRMR
jgi:hypothetical protein